jgi:rubrerythrin
MNDERTTIQFDSIAAVLDFAIGKEEEASAFYIEWSKRVESDPIREVLREFSNEELKHKQKLLDVKHGEVVLEQERAIVDLHLTDYFIDPIPSREMSYQEALLLAVRREKDAIAMYRRLSQVYADSGLRPVFDALAEEEQKHKLKLESIYDDAFMKED